MPATIPHMPNFAVFARELAALCRKHGVTLASAANGAVGVWDVVSGKESELVDCTAPTNAPRVEHLPDYFDTGIQAREHPGYIGEAQSERLARDLQAKHPGSQVVQIGPRPRGWVVVQPQSVQPQRKKG